MKYDKREKLCYIVHGKKSFPVTTNGYFSFNIKGNSDVDKEFKQVGRKIFPFRFESNDYLDNMITIDSYTLAEEVKRSC